MEVKKLINSLICSPETVHGPLTGMSACGNVRIQSLYGSSNGFCKGGHK